ncbi:hypothetical protein ACWDT6_12590 [Nocardia grenadensis]
MRRKITITFDRELPPELYADIANTVWMQMYALAGRGRHFEYAIESDGGKALRKELDDEWDQLGEQARWSDDR